MAIIPKSFDRQTTLAPGGRGEQYQLTMPGYSNTKDRISRSNNKLNAGDHDTLNINYNFDRRLNRLFVYGLANGYNQIVIPKGRIVAADPCMSSIDIEKQKAYNVLTLANGGVPVRLREAKDVYQVFKTSDKADAKETDIISPGMQGKALNAMQEWTPLTDESYCRETLRGFAGAYAEDTKLNAPLTPNEILTKAGYEIGPNGKVVVSTNKAEVTNVRPGNFPLGMIIRNEYTRNDDALNGMAPGAVVTDKIVEFPWFLYKDKAEQNPWGSVYGAFFPGAYAKSDENGRIIVSPLSYPELVKTMTLTEYELERQQVIGQCYSVSKELVPFGAAKYAQWALEDRLEYQGFNPSEYRGNNRDGEDTVENSPYRTDGTYAGYGFEKNYGAHDLHMIASNRTYDNRMQLEYQLENGIPGLTDGYNAVATDKEENLGTLHKSGTGEEYDKFSFRTVEVDVHDLKISVGGAEFVKAEVGAKFGTDGCIKITYCNEMQGIIVMEVTDKAKADAFIAEGKDVKVKYVKRGKSGVPTFLDWEGCIGSVKIILQK